MFHQIWSLRNFVLENLHFNAMMAVENAKKAISQNLSAIAIQLFNTV